VVGEFPPEHVLGEDLAAECSGYFLPSGAEGEFGNSDYRNVFDKDRKLLGSLEGLLSLLVVVV